ncbi:MAG: hypothetical protein AAF152_05455 [Cyanobacteria bacterium P01_A01_bin.114]
MKRLLKKTFQQYFSTPSSKRREESLAQISRRFSRCASVMTAVTLGLLGTAKTAHAFFLYEVDLSNYTPLSLNETILFPGTPAGIRFQWTGATDTFQNLSADDNSGLTGGFEAGDILNIQFDPTVPADQLNLDVTFENNGTPVPVENVRLIVIDIDRDNANAWQDQVTLGGAAPAPLITPATDATPALGISPEAAINSPISVEETGLPPLNDNDYTVEALGDSFVGVYAPPGPANLTGSNTAVNVLSTPGEFNPNLGGNPVTLGDSLPEQFEGNNGNQEGTITADYGATPGQPVNGVSLVYGNGPASLTAATNPAGPGGFINLPGDNGGPANHGIGLYTVFFTPGVIGTGKTVSAPTPGPNGTFNATYTIRVQNFGVATELTDVQVTDDLVATFGDAAGFTVSNVQAAGGVNLTVNADFSGVDPQTSLLAPGQSLAPGEFTLIQYDVNIDPAVTGLGPFDNTAVGTANTPIGLPVIDQSVDDVDPGPDGPNPDPNGDGDPLETDPTQLTLVEPTTSQIGVSKQVLSSVLTPDGAFGANTARVVYGIEVENIGSEALDDVQLTDSLEDTFGDGNYQLVGPPQFVGGNANLDAINPNYDGDNQGDLNLLDPAAVGRSLPVGAASTFQITVDVNIASNTLPNPLPGPFENQAEAVGTGTDSGTETTDLSNDATAVPPGQDPIDPNDNGVANEDGENVPTPVFLGANIRLTKRITQVLRNGQPLFVPQINQFNDQGSDTTDNALQTLSNNALPLGLFSAPSLLQTGDIVEYTVYFFNDGTTPVQNIELCDVLRVPNVLQADSLLLALPNTTPPTDGSFAASPLIEARAPLAPLAPSCEDVAGTGNFPPGPSDRIIPGAGGGVVVGASDNGAPSGLDLDANEIGAFRFQVIIP